MGTLRIKLSSTLTDTGNGASHHDYYLSGSRVSGNVVFDSPTPIQLTAATITLRGRGKVKIRSSEHYFTLTYRSRALFFPPIGKTLFIADNTTGANRLENKTSSRASSRQLDYDHPILNRQPLADQPVHHVWPFEFQIPDRCDVRNVKQPPSSTPALTMPRFAPFDVTSKPQQQPDRQGAVKPATRTAPSFVVNETEATRMVWENDYFAASDPFSASADTKILALPGTFEYNSTRGPVKWEGRVEYELFATVTKMGGSVLFPTKELSATLQLPLRTRAPAQAPGLLKQRTTISMSGPLLIRQTDAAGTEKLISEGSTSAGPTRRISLLDRTQSLLRPGAFTKATLFVSVETPSYVRPGRTIFLSVSHMRPSFSPPSTAPVPKLRLKELTLTLLSTTTVRDNAATAQEQRCSRSDASVLHKRKDLDIPLPVRASDHNFSLSPVMPEVPPTFSTFNIARGYWLSVEMRIEVGGSEIVKLNHDGVRVVVLSDVSAGEDTSTSIPTYEEATIGMTGEESSTEKREKCKGEDAPPAASAVEEQLPAYEP